MSEDLKYRLKQMPTDVWSVREKLALASSVMRSGDQNWVSVSRAIRPFGNPGRPSDWFSQKNCALQYSALLEKVETPRRKRGEREVTETPGDVIVRKLTIERIEELKRIIQEEAVRYRSLKNDLELVRSGQVDSQIKEMWEKLQAEKIAAKEAAAKKAADELRARELAKAAASRLKKPLALNLRKVMGISTSDHEDSTQDSVFDAPNNEDSNQSGLSAPTMPGASRVVDGAMGSSSAPASPLPSLLQKEPKSPELQYSAIDQTQHNDLPDVPTIEALIDDNSIELKKEPVDIGDEASILNTPDDNDIGSVELPMEQNHISDDSLQDAIDAAIAVMKENDGEIKVEELITSEFNSPDFQDFDAASSAEPVIQDSEVVISTADTPLPEAESISCQTSPVKTSPVVDDVVPVSTSAVSEPTSVDNEIILSVQKPAIVVEETFEEASSPASSILSTDIGSGHHKATPTTHKSARGAKAKQTPKRSSQTRQSEESKESEKSVRPCDVDSSEDEASSNHVLDENTNDVFSTSMVRQKIELIESLPNSPASFSHSDTEDEKAHKIWKKSIMLVWRSAANHKFANVFLHPVTEDIAPGYHSVVHRPMDLSTIKKNIDNGAIRTTAEFQRDMMLMFINAMMYNNVEHDVHKMAVSMYNDVMMHIEHFVNTQMMVQAEPKLLRTLRRADAHSDKEEDSRKRKTSEVELQQQPQQQSQQQQQSTPSGTGSSAAKKRR